VTAALAVVTAGSDFRPSEYPSAKNSAQIPTSPKNKNSSLPVPSVISVSSDEAIVTPVELTTVQSMKILNKTHNKLFVIPTRDRSETEGIRFPLFENPLCRLRRLVF
jgi:hypothetical protein